jgi:hypothetical protein
MTWVYVAEYDNISDLLKYARRQGMKIIPGTFDVRTLTQAREYFEQLSTTARYLHLTFSLPEGLKADDTVARRIIATDMALRGIPPDAVPWIMVRHTDTNCDHYHVAVQLRLMTGMHLQARASEAVSQNNDRILRDVLCFPPLSHYDPTALPTLRPNTPKRRLDTPDKARLHTDLQRVFLEDQPIDFDGFSRGMSRIESPFSVEHAPIDNDKNHKTYSATGPISISLNALGKAWWPSAIKKRFVHATVLRALRPLLQFRSLITGLVRAEKEIHNDPSRPQAPHAVQRSRHPDEQDRAGQKPGGMPATPARPADDATGGGRSGHDQAPAVGHDRRGSRIEGAHPSTAKSDEPIRNTGTKPDCHDGYGERYTPAYLASDGPRPGHGWLGRLSTAAQAKGGRLHRLLRSETGTFTAAFIFDDGGEIYGDQQETWVIKQSPKADDVVHGLGGTPAAESRDYEPSS